VVLGVAGGIAAYKAAELCRALIQRGFAVQVVMTAAAEQFITPLTFAALTGRKVITGLFSSSTSNSEATLASAVEHIGVAQDNEVLVVAPATADLLAKFAHGMADDFLTTMYLAFTGPVVLAPAMNTNMWLHAATQANLATLGARGHSRTSPRSGRLPSRDDLRRGDVRERASTRGRRGAVVRRTRHQRRLATPDRG